MIENELPLAIKAIMSQGNTRIQIDDAYVNLKHDSEKLRSAWSRLASLPQSLVNWSILIFVLVFPEEFSDIKGTYDDIQQQIDGLRHQIYSNFRPEIKVN